MSLFLFSGCLVAKTQEGATSGEKVTHKSGQSVGMVMNSVAVLDKSLQKWQVFEETADGSIHHVTVGKIAVESSGAKRNETGTLKVWAVLRNRTDFPLQVQARVQFFDEYKVPVEGPSSWQRIILSPNSISAYKENSMGMNDLKYYYIEVREGR
ncbi:hypothetical protein N9A28_03265 [Sulfurimonas sp.]|nr:hypothetical protein [Sulfurimonas sp.]